MLSTKLRKETKEFLIENLESALSDLLPNRKRVDVEIIEHLLATVESAKLLQESMPVAQNLKSRFNLLDYSIKNVSVDGLWMEFGVYKGKSIRKIAEQSKAEIFGFDSFEGLPQDWILSYKKGDFSLKGSIPEDLPLNVKLVKGLFSESIPAFLEEHDEPVAFLHIDCDLYMSTNTVLSHLHSRVKSGTIILFDEFFNFPQWQQHEYRAFMEFIDETKFSYEFIGYASAYNSVAVRITGLSSDNSEPEIGP
jgi:Methyltransferase domain